MDKWFGFGFSFDGEQVKRRNCELIEGKLMDGFKNNKGAYWDWCLPKKKWFYKRR